MKKLLLILGLLLVGAGCSSTGPRAEPESTQNLPQKMGIKKLTVSGELPSPRQLPSVAYDGVLQRFYVFGGLTDEGYVNDLYQLNIDSGVWEKLTITGDKPSPRFGTPLMLDQAGGNLYLFGGQGDDSAFLNDLWRFDLKDKKWTKLVAKGPEGRYGHGGIFDESSGPVIFAGFVGKGRSNETWGFNLKEQKWENISPADVDRPQRRCLLGYTHAPGDKSFWIFGGQSTGIPWGKPFLGDFWRFDLETKLWKSLSVDSKVQARKWPTLTAFNDEIYIFGGESAQGDLNDLWIFEKEKSNWTQLVTPIPARSSHGAAADLNDKRLIIFGGLSGSANLNDTWIIDLEK